ncbi:uncharacterized protein LOC129310856 [Prosopis cineraria]|uniref:uncharacterized protein LOC129310856 n=1 Tax=Prosopis cineraria TaxID=364024 RepID=UPI00240F6300|nr:uncharacterized protein LOC129310856 [Prosopis cineraria]
MDAYNVNALDKNHFVLLNNLDRTKITWHILIKVDQMYACVGQEVYELDLGYPNRDMMNCLLKGDSAVDAWTTYQSYKYAVIFKLPGRDFLQEFKNVAKVRWYTNPGHADLAGSSL